MSTKAVTPDSNPALENVELEVPSGDAYERWRKTGELPGSDEEIEEIESKQREEEDAAQKETPSSKEDSATSESVTRAGSEPAPRKKDANSRIRELVAELKSEREERRRLSERLTAAPAIADKSDKQDSQPAKADASKAAAEPNLDDVDEKGVAKYKTFGDWQNAHNNWIFEEAERRAEAKITSRFEESQKTSARQQEVERIQKSFQPRVQKARTKYADFDAVAFNKDLPITQGSLVEAFILESEAGPEVAYYLGQHPEELAKITGLSQQKNDKGQFLRIADGMSAAQAGRYLTLLELSLSEEDDAPPPKRPLAKPVTQAPPPPRQVGGKPPQTKSEEAAALEDDDFDSYRAAMNRKEIADRSRRTQRK